MKNSIIYLFILVFCLNSNSQQIIPNKIPNQFFDLEKIIKDSLTFHNIDTFIIYQYGSTGCPSTIFPFISVYWVKDNIPHLRIVTEKNIFHKKKLIKQIIKEVSDGNYIYNLGFISTNLDLIKETKILNKNDNMFFVNENEEKIQIKIGIKAINFERKMSYRKEEVNFKSIVIDDFRSFLLNFFIENKL